MKKSFVKSAVGIAAGLLNGLFGAGGGAVVVPAVKRFLGEETHKAHACAVAVMLPLSAVSAAVYFTGAYSADEKPDYLMLLFVSAGGMLGGFAGAKLLNKIPSGALRKIFGILIAAAAIRMIL